MEFLEYSTKGVRKYESMKKCRDTKETSRRFCIRQEGILSVWHIAEEHGSRFYLHGGIKRDGIMSTSVPITPQW